MLRNIVVIIISFGFSHLALAQQPSSQPPVKVNVLNVCTPSPEDQQEIASALAKIPKQPQFAADFEIDRGRSTLDQSPDFLQGGGNTHLLTSAETADWVRIRHEFPPQAMFSTVQYSFSRDPKNMAETLVFHVRDPKDDSKDKALLQIAIEDSASSVTTAAGMLAANTPTSRIKLERFGKSSIVLARCEGTDENPGPDQKAYQPLFSIASEIAGNYRNSLGVRRTVPEELDRIRASGASRSGASRSGTTKSKAATKANADKPAPESK